MQPFLPTAWCKSSQHILLAPGGGAKGRSKTELLTAIPPKGRADGENGYFLATPSIVEYLDYEVDGTYR